ncbi:PbsX family transcriptional regulator [Inquilinus limosus]|uniref:AbrB/MazE/SpoVT family DNA-binding domain-containing protein n=1 Tax=Inquilinus limosus TaxID=171674 RepID=UPI003F178171
MRVTVKKSGKRAVVRIPASIMEEAGLSIDQIADIRIEDGRIIIEPVQAPAYDLDELLAGITEENVHAEISFGVPVGREAL